MSHDGLPLQPVEVVCVDGRRAVLRASLLAAGQVDAVIALHREVIRAMPAELVASETPEFFADHADRIGRLFGLFDDERLIAYSVLGLPGAGDPNFGVDHGLSAQDLARVAHLDGAAVHPRYRGNGLHRRMIAWRLATARAAGRSIALSTVAPGNVASLASMLSEGLQIRALAHRFGGQRFLMRRDEGGQGHGGLTAGGVDVDAIDHWLPLGAVRDQRELLSRGWAGLALRRTPAGTIEIGYRRAGRSPEGCAGTPAGPPVMKPRSRQ